MAISYLETGRTQQKARTRQALVDAARRLLARGITPSVEQAAAEASVSRPTAYRYFPNQRALLVAVHPEIEETVLLGEDPPGEPEERFLQTVDAIIRLVLDNEHELRAALRLSLELPAGDREELVFRRGRAIGWLEEALSPLRERMPAPALRRLALATRASCGIEPLVWLLDIAGLSRERAAEVMRWSAHSLYRAALSEAGIDA